MQGSEFDPGLPVQLRAAPDSRAGSDFVVGFVIILSAIGILVACGAKNSMVYYVTVTELLGSHAVTTSRGSASPARWSRKVIERLRAFVPG
ncbi:MAG: hypothetical protein U0527_15740 [Candidatus Eisenbacteria bacterium]